MKIMNNSIRSCTLTYSNTTIGIEKKCTFCVLWQDNINLDIKTGIAREVWHTQYDELCKDSYRYGRNTPTLIFEIWNQ